MIKEEIAAASTIDEAKAKAKAALNAPDSVDVKYEVMQMPQKKVLGLFGGKEAKVKAFYEQPDAKPAVEKKQVKKTEKREAPKSEAKPQTVSEPISDKDDAKIRAYLEMIVTGMGIEDVKITKSIDEDETVYDIATESNYGALIGRHGETLDAVQYLVRLYANKNTEGHQKVSLNVGDYREKRTESLKALAARSASQVLKYGRNAKLEPMNPYERRIVHTAVQGIEGVTSHSVGFDSERRVIITLEEGVQPTHGDRRTGGRGGYNNNRGGNRGGYNNRGNGGRREGYKPNIPADRAPKTDIAGGARYGKIEVAKKSEEE